MPRSLVCERLYVLPHLITVVSRHSRHFGYGSMRCDGDSAVRAPADVPPERNSSGGGAHNGSGDERPDIFAFRGILCFLGVGLLGGGPASAWSAARSASADLTSACSASGCSAAFSASGRSAADSVVVGAATVSPPSSCDPHLSVLSNDFAGFALFSGGKHEGIATIGKRLAP